MKRITLTLVLMFSAHCLFSQIGINTTEPTTTLDVNGNIRMRGDNFRYEDPIMAVKIIGVDEDGNFVEVEIDENVVLEDNKLRATDRVMEIGDAPGINLPVVNDLNLVILPGEPNNTKNVLRMQSILGDMILTGLAPGEDGQKIWLYPISGDLTIFTNSILSLFGNRIEGSGPLNVQQYEMIQLMYDATRTKWIPMR